MISVSSTDWKILKYVFVRLLGNPRFRTLWIATSFVNAVFASRNEAIHTVKPPWIATSLACGLPPRKDASRPFTTVRLCEHAFSCERSVAGSNPLPSKNNDGHRMTVIVCFYSRPFSHPAPFTYAFSIRSE